MEQNYFIKRNENIKPIIYVYKINDNYHKGQLKVGFTSKGDAKKRIDEQTKTLRVNYEIVLEEEAMKSNGDTFKDKDVHKVLKENGIKVLKHDGSNRDSEWFQCGVEEIKRAILQIKEGIITDSSRTKNFKMRPEQKEAVFITKKYFSKFEKEKNIKPKFLWNCKMRFGKTFTAYHLIKEMNFKNILVLTFKPAVESAWKEDINSHIDFKGWTFYSLTEENDNTKLNNIFNQSDNDRHDRAKGD